MEPPGQPSFYREGTLKPKEKQSFLVPGIRPHPVHRPSRTARYTPHFRAELKAGTGSQMLCKKQTKFSLFL